MAPRVRNTAIIPREYGNQGEHLTAQHDGTFRSLLFPASNHPHDIPALDCRPPNSCWLNWMAKTVLSLRRRVNHTGMENLLGRKRRSARPVQQQYAGKARSTQWCAKAFCGHRKNRSRFDHGAIQFIRRCCYDGKIQRGKLFGIERLWASCVEPA